MTKLNHPSSDSRIKTSRRALLRGLMIVPVAASVAPRSWDQKLALLSQRYVDPPANLLRSREGRRLSRARYHRAESFFLPMASCQPSAQSDMLYRAGIVAQLALSSHLLDVGFADKWCARWISLRVTKALEYANATGLGDSDAETARMADVLTPYWVWRRPTGRGEAAPDDGGCTIDQVRPLLRGLLDRVHNVTGHPHPKGWHCLYAEARS